MNLRVTQQTVLQRALSDTQRLTSQLTNLQAQASSGKRLLAVSDDPSASLSILASSAQDRMIGAHLDNINNARSALDAGVAALQQTSSVLAAARNVALEASNSVNDTTSFEALATQVDGLLDRLLSLANTQHNDTYIFGGSSIRTQPFAVTNTNTQGRPVEVRYQAAYDATTAIVDTRQQVAVFYPGTDVFMAKQRQPAVFLGSTGAQVGAGTNSADGKVKLIFQHVSTTFAAGSGVQPGTNSAAGDTILGPAGAHRLQIIDTSGTGSSGTVSLDGGAIASFTNADTNLRLTSPTGDSVYVDMSAITAGFNGDVDITATGAMSLDGAATFTTLTFSADQYAQNSFNQEVVFVDTTDVRRTGTEVVENAGTTDAFQSLIALRDELRNVNGLTYSDQIEAISHQLSELDFVRGNVLQVMGEQSATLQTLESLQANLQDMQNSAQKNVSELENADVTDLVIKLQGYQQLLQLSLATFARINEQTLLDFLR